MNSILVKNEHQSRKMKWNSGGNPCNKNITERVIKKSTITTETDVYPPTLWSTHPKRDRSPSGRVVQKAISANPGLKFNRLFILVCSAWQLKFSNILVYIFIILSTKFPLILVKLIAFWTTGSWGYKALIMIWDLGTLKPLFAKQNSFTTLLYI